MRPLQRVGTDVVGAAQRLKTLDPYVPLAKVDATENDALATRFSVTGYPTIKVFRDGVAEEYKGPRDADGIFEHAKKISSFYLPRVRTDAELATIQKSKYPVVLGLFREPVKASKAFQAFKEVAFEMTGQPVVLAYAASYSTPPVMPPLDAKARSRMCRASCCSTRRAQSRACPCRAERRTLRRSTLSTGSTRTASRSICPRRRTRERWITIRTTMRTTTSTSRARTMQQERSPKRAMHSIDRLSVPCAVAVTEGRICSRRDRRRGKRRSSRIRLEPSR